MSLNLSEFANAPFTYARYSTKGLTQENLKDQLPRVQENFSSEAVKPSALSLVSRPPTKSKPNGPGISTGQNHN
jgi:hypothetical protein